MKKLKVPNIVTIMILTVITISFWIVFSVVRIFRTEPTPSIPPEILNPLNSNYDKTVVDKIEKRTYFDKEQIFETAQLSPSPTASPIASPTASPESATGSGELSL
jgi:hypothetical protein